jgi:chorismate mutase
VSTVPSLQRRLAEVSAEIRHYPTPIARCDEQLTALIEERTSLLQRLSKPRGCTPLATWTNDGGFDAA